MRLTLQSRQVLCSRSSSHSISSLRPRSDFHRISEAVSLQTKKIRLLPADLLNVFDEVRKADQLFPLANCFNQWVCFPVYKPVRLYLHFILTMSLEECQTNGMNLLLHTHALHMVRRCGRAFCNEENCHSSAETHHYHTATAATPQILGGRVRILLSYLLGFVHKCCNPGRSIAFLARSKQC